MIYIRDMEMPIDCLECRIGCIYATSLVIGRPSDCPLAEAKDGDLISRAEAIDAMGEEPPIVYDLATEWKEHDVWVRNVSALSALPSAEALQGEWIHDGSQWANRWVCDKCGHKIFEPKTNYCPNCGAKMKAR